MLKSLIVLVIVKELYCYLRKTEENSSEIFEKIFGIPFFDGLDLTEATDIYNYSNWNTINYFTTKHYKIENPNRLINFIKIKKGWGPCVEIFDINLSEQYKYSQ